jgi:surface antigen
LFSGAQNVRAGQLERLAGFCQKAFIVFICAFAASSCASGMNLSKIRSVDFLPTGSVSASRSKPVDHEALSDETTIRNAVTSANLEHLDNAPLHWENKDTGSRGVVTGIEEYKDKYTLCRRFFATRESFDGVAAYRGDTCLTEGGYWWIKEFEQV